MFAEPARIVSNTRLHALLSGCSSIGTAPFIVRGLKAYSGTDIYAVGDSNHVAHYNGAGWTTFATFNNTTALKRIRGTTACDLWTVGSNGVVATTNKNF